jgi:hypothetical protein
MMRFVIFTYILTCGNGDESQPEISDDFCRLAAYNPQLPR